jgi:predicted transcriptional regulator
MKKDRMFSIRIDADTLEKLRKVAQKRDRSVNYVIVEALRDLVKGGMK